MKINWGWKIALLYIGFMGLIVTLVVASSRQKCDLVSKDYYAQEIAYGRVMDAGKNQSALSQPMQLHADRAIIAIDFPLEFKNKVLSGSVKFYAPANAEWDRDFKIDVVDSKFEVPRTKLINTRYVIKIDCIADGKHYYQESEIMLHS